MRIVPEAVMKLRDIAVEAMPANFTVYVGDPPGGDVPDEYFAVAYGGDDRPGIQGTARPADFGNPGEGGSESFAVWCTVSTASGDERADLTLGRSAELYGLFVAALRQPGNRNLGGLLAAGGFADIGAYEWTSEQGGQITTVFFQVDVMARWAQWS